MTPSQRQIEILIFIAMIKMMSEQSTRLQGELSRDTKAAFNSVVKPAELFVRNVERDITAYDAYTLEVLTDSLHDGIAGLRKELFNSIKIK